MEGGARDFSSWVEGGANRFLSDNFEDIRPFFEQKRQYTYDFIGVSLNLKIPHLTSRKQSMAGVRRSIKNIIHN